MQEQHYYLRRCGEEWEIGTMSAVKLDFSGAAQSRTRQPLRRFSSQAKAQAHYRKLTE
jgi:hypothetical protein